MTLKLKVAIALAVGNSACAPLRNPAAMPDPALMRAVIAEVRSAISPDARLYIDPRVLPADTAGGIDHASWRLRRERAPRFWRAGELGLSRADTLVVATFVDSSAAVRCSYNARCMAGGPGPGRVMAVVGRPELAGDVARLVYFAFGLPEEHREGAMIIVGESHRAEVLLTLRRRGGRWEVLHRETLYET
jgi:hypothetical protein